MDAPSVWSESSVLIVVMLLRKQGEMKCHDWLAVTVLRCSLPAAEKQVRHQMRKQICCHS